MHTPQTTQKERKREVKMRIKAINQSNVGNWGKVKDQSNDTVNQSLEHKKLSTDKQIYNKKLQENLWRKKINIRKWSKRVILSRCIIIYIRRNI